MSRGRRRCVPADDGHISLLLLRWPRDDLSLLSSQWSWADREKERKTRELLWFSPPFTLPSSTCFVSKEKRRLYFDTHFVSCWFCYFFFILYFALLIRLLLLFLVSLGFTSWRDLSGDSSRFCSPWCSSSYSLLSLLHFIFRALPILIASLQSLCSRLKNLSRVHLSLSLSLSVHWLRGKERLVLCLKRKRMSFTQTLFMITSNVSQERHDWVKKMQERKDVSGDVLRVSMRNYTES